jgi:hypothetical protein
LSVLPNTKALLAFAGRFLLSFCLVLPLWFLFAPAYNRLLASGVNLVLPLIESAPVPRLEGWEHDLLLTRPGSTPEGGKKIQGFRGNLTHFNLILMVALVFSLRRIDWRSRCKLLAMALGILLVAHLVYLLLGIKFFEQPAQEALQSSAGRFYVWGVNFYLSMASQLLPFVIGWFLYRFLVRSHEEGLPFGPERHVNRAEKADARIKSARRAKRKRGAKSD